MSSGYQIFISKMALTKHVKRGTYSMAREGEGDSQEY